MQTIEIPQRPTRIFLGEDFQLTDWNSLLPFFQELTDRPLESEKDLRKWLLDRSELESYLSENMAWRYINMSCDTASEEKRNAYYFFVQEISPNAALFDDQLNKKVLECAFTANLTDSGFPVMLRGMKKAVEIFRESNIDLVTQSQTKQVEYQSTTGAMTVDINGEEMTLQKAQTLLQSVNRKVRKEAWEKVGERYYADKDKLDEIFDELKTLRHQMAINADFANYRDYMFAAMGRFDYTPQDCFDFHNSVQKAVIPLLNEAATDRKAKLGYEELRPWDTKVDVKGRAALRPFETSEELLDKTIACFEKIDGKLADYLRIMRRMGHFDLDSRKGKAPGGYNYPLEEIGVPFIFMNAASSMRDVITMVHEGGHAVHSFEVRNLPINAFRRPPMEVAELASMAMELISMEGWDAFFANEEDLKRAKIEHLGSVLSTLPWIATIDKFQHWLYENPQHTPAERKAYWIELYNQFTDSVVDWTGYEEIRAYLWQRQLHIFEVPFYYIEYGMAQLGAISVWRNFKADKKKGLDGYLAALRMGYTAPIGEIYAAANIKFDFSESYISELMSFVKAEMDALK